MENLCCICKRELDPEAAPLLTMSAIGNPRYICPLCDEDMSIATTDRSTEHIFAAMDRIGKSLSDNKIEDSLVLDTVKEIMTGARERAEKIKLGEYDFSEEEAAAEEEDGVPEELQETEEDKRLEEEEAKRNAKLDKITNWVCLAILLGAVGYFIYRVFLKS